MRPIHIPQSIDAEVWKSLHASQNWLQSNCFNLENTIEMVILLKLKSMDITLKL